MYLLTFEFKVQTFARKPQKSSAVKIIRIWQ